MANYYRSQGSKHLRRKRVLFLMPIILIVGFLIWQSQQNSNIQEKILPKKVYQIYLDIKLADQITPVIDQVFTDNNREYNLVNNQNEAEVIISFNQISNMESAEIAKIYQAEYKKTDYNSWEAPYESIFFSFKKSSSIISKLEKGIKDHFNQTQWSMVAVGDVMLARHVGKKMIDNKDWNLPFLKTANLLNSADITFANLESPFDEGGQKIFQGMVFGADPQSISGLKYAGIDIVSLANNHFGNRGSEGMNYTFNLLKQNKIEYVGAGNNFDQAHEVKILETKAGLKIAFLAYDGVDSTPQGYVADADSAGLAKWDINQVKKDIAEAKKLEPDLIIVSMHAGNEYVYQSQQDKIDFSHAVIDAGADLVIGHHPHCNQSIETYHGNLIFYSLGNFVFDQMWSEKTKEGLAIKLNFYGNNIKSFDLVPIYIEDYNQPQIATQSKAEEILSHILPLSHL